MRKEGLLPTPILEIDDYINLMNLQNGTSIVQTVLNDKKKKLTIVKEKKRCASYKLAYDWMYIHFYVQRLILLQVSHKKGIEDGGRNHIEGRL